MSSSSRSERNKFKFVREHDLDDNSNLFRKNLKPCDCAKTEKAAIAALIDRYDRFKEGHPIERKEVIAPLGQIFLEIISIDLMEWVFANTEKVIV